MVKSELRTAGDAPHQQLEVVIELFLLASGEIAQGHLVVLDLVLAQDHGVARFDVLDEIAEITKGKLVPVSEVQSLLDHLATLPEPESTIHRIRLWSHPILSGILIVLMGVFWVGRKMIGAV